MVGTTDLVENIYTYTYRDEKKNCFLFFFTKALSDLVYLSYLPWNLVIYIRETFYRLPLHEEWGSTNIYPHAFHVWKIIFSGDFTFINFFFIYFLVQLFFFFIFLNLFFHFQQSSFHLNSRQSIFSYFTIKFLILSNSLL